MKLKNLYEEVAEQQRNIVALDKEQAKEILLTQCKQTINYIRNKPNDFIYRGFGKHITASMLTKNNYSLVVPFKRESRNTYNFYTLIIDHDPAWQKFPPRSKSLICSTTNDLMSYGKMRIVIPFDQTKFGVCDGPDIWYSFKRRDNFPFYNLDDFNMVIAKIIIDDVERVHIDNSDKIRAFNKTLSYQSFVNKIDEARKKNGKIDQMIKANNDNPFYKMNEDVLIFLHRIKNEGIEFLQSCLNPNKNNFRLSNYESLPFNTETEIWFGNQGVVFDANQDKVDEFFNLIR